MKKKFTLSSIFEKKWVVFVISVFLAIAVWIFVTYTIDTEATRTIRNVPISVDDRDASYRNYGLHILGYEPEYVDVVVKGDRAFVNSLTADNFKVAPSYSGVEHPGTHTLNLSVSRVNSQQGGALTMTLSKTTVDIVFDTETQKTLAVEQDVKNFIPGEGLVGGTISVSPSEITVIGPETEVERVVRVIASYELSGVQTESQTVYTAYTLLDKNGNEVPQDNLALSEDEAEINIPVLKRGILPLGIEFINVPEGFDTSTLDYALSHTEIEVLANESIVDNLQTKIVGRIDLATFEVGKEYSFPIVLSENMRPVDEAFNTVTVTFPKDSLSSVKVRVTEFAIDNAPANFDIEILTKVINNVTVIGPSEEIAALLDTSVVAILDAGTFTVESGEYDRVVTFSIPGNNSLWVAGKYTVLVSVTTS